MNDSNAFKTRLQVITGCDWSILETDGRESGLQEGAVLTAIVLPPVYGALGHAGISAPDEARPTENKHLSAWDL